MLLSKVLYDMFKYIKLSNDVNNKTKISPTPQKKSGKKYNSHKPTISTWETSNSLDVKKSTNNNEIS